MNTIYFTQSGENGPVRVAMSTGQAIARLQSGNPEQLVNRLIYEAERDDLRRLQERYGRHHIRGDWFYADVLLDPPEHLHEIDFDRAAQARHIAEQAEAEQRRGAELALASLADTSQDAPA